MPRACLWGDPIAPRVHTDRQTPLMTVGLNPIQFPVTGLHHWAHLQQATPAVYLHALSLTPYMGLASTAVHL